MKASELRVGQTYKAPIEFFKGSVEMKIGAKDEVFTLTQEGMVLLFQLDLLKFLQHIQLNEEWLVKFGFKWHSKASTHTGFGLIKTNDFLFSVYPNDNRIFFNLSFNQSDTNHLINNVKYAHQLQNLYFALTGEELSIKDAGLVT